MMTLIEMLRNSVIKKYYVNKYSENPNNKLISDITSTSNIFLGGNNSNINIEPRKFNIPDIETNNLDDITFNENVKENNNMN